MRGVLGLTGPTCGLEVELRLRPRIFMLLLLIDTTCDFGHITPPVAATRNESNVWRVKKVFVDQEKKGEKHDVQGFLAALNFEREAITGLLVFCLNCLL